ncbi:hypothetical protein H8A97_43435 [Bradyrhizobium sp. Arg62]|nr:hypothetical protein [Bradyrhizobium brasilense]
MTPRNRPVRRRRLPNTLYGVLDQAEPSDDGVWLMFGTVSGDWLQGQLGPGPGIPIDPAGRTQFYAAMPLYLLEIRLSAEDVLAIGSSKKCASFLSEVTRRIRRTNSARSGTQMGENQPGG